MQYFENCKNILVDKLLSLYYIETQVKTKCLWGRVQVPTDGIVHDPFIEKAEPV